MSHRRWSSILSIPQRYTIRAPSVAWKHAYALTHTHRLVFDHFKSHLPGNLPAKEVRKHNSPSSQQRLSGVPLSKILNQQLHQISRTLWCETPRCLAVKLCHAVRKMPAQQKFSWVNEGEKKKLVSHRGLSWGCLTSFVQSASWTPSCLFIEKREVRRCKKPFLLPWDIGIL